MGGLPRGGCPPEGKARGWLEPTVTAWGTDVRPPPNAPAHGDVMLSRMRHDPNWFLYVSGGDIRYGYDD